MDDSSSVEPSAADQLAQCEAVIAQGLQTFVDVGNALVAIKAHNLYQAAGYDTFDAYCSERWGIERSQRGRLMHAATIATDLLTPMGVDASAVEVPPTSERQVRPLAQLSTPEDQRAAWDEAVADAGGAPPTGAQVEAVVRRRWGRTVAPERRQRPAPLRQDIVARIVEDIAATATGIGSILRNAAGDVSEFLMAEWERAEMALRLQRVVFAEQRAETLANRAIADAIAKGTTVEQLADACDLDVADVLARAGRAQAL